MEPPPRDCEEIADGRLPALEEFLDPSELVPALRSMSTDGEVLLTVATRAGGEEIRIYRSEAVDGEEEGEIGLWPVVLRQVLREPPPEAAVPGVRVRLIPGPEGGVRLEPSILCRPEFRNRDEVEARYRTQMADAGRLVDATVSFQLSELGGIQQLTVRMAEGAEDLEIFARRAVHFARFRPATLDGRRVPSTVEITFPDEGT